MNFCRCSYVLPGTLLSGLSFFCGGMVALGYNELMRTKCVDDYIDPATFLDSRIANAVKFIFDKDPGLLDRLNERDPPMTCDELRGMRILIGSVSILLTGIILGVTLSLCCCDAVSNNRGPLTNRQRDDLKRHQLIEINKRK